ncbi:MAG TPA: hypothetical protein VHE80_11035, partial [Acidimicrobiales bacterium]|nr:hypothetical protein [Acidimicrobiales bacterium]
MRADRVLDEATVEALLRGRPVPDGPLTDLVGFLDDMRAVGRGPALPASPALASVLASGLTTEEDVLPASAATNGSGRARQAAEPRDRRRRTVIQTLLTTIASKLAVLGVAAKAALGLSVAAATLAGAAVAGVPAAEDAVEAVTPIDFSTDALTDDLNAVTGDVVGDDVGDGDEADDAVGGDDDGL